MATIYDVAKRASVSTYTVSSVVNKSAYVSPELTARVVKAIKELRYTPNALARGLQTRRSKTMGMLIPDVANPFYAKVVRGAEDRLREAGYSLLLGNTYNDPEEQTRYLSVFRSQQADGYLLFQATGDEGELKDLVQSRTPAVFIGRTPQTFRADCVSADNTAATQLAVEHLVAAGHENIGIITGHRSLSSSFERVEGWKKVMKKRKLRTPATYIGEGDWSTESGYSAAIQMLGQKPRPTAIFVSNFLMMIGALQALRDGGLRCPKDVQIASSDDSEWLDVFEPAITTVVQPSHEMGRAAADLVLKRIERPTRRFEQITLASQLRVRPAVKAKGA